MSIKFIPIAAVLILVAPLPALAEGRTLQSRIDDFNTCSKNGGDMSVCCAIAGGTYDPPHKVTAAGGREVTVETCVIERQQIVHTIGGKTAIIRAPGLTSLN